jgi:hypothetical protein
MNRNVVLYIDEEQSALDAYGTVLRRQLPADLEVVCEKPSQTLPQMLKHLTGMRDKLTSIILDEHLEVAGTADYIGSDLANAYRQIDNKIPIYILSNHPEEIDSNLQSVEYVLSKDDFADGGSALDSATKRITRHINAYGEIVSEREQRFVELLRKYVTSEITQDESAEFDELKLWREAPTAIEESQSTIALRQALDNQEQSILEIEELLKGKG